MGVYDEGKKMLTMREIIFRGKTEKGEWVYGDLLHPDNCGNGYSIEDFTKDKNNCFDVIPETVGQYTGLTDKNGKKIFEGDIIIELDGGMDGIPRKVVWEEEYMQYKCPLVRRHWAYDYNECGLWMVQSENIEVIGNIHDNPELIGGGEDA